MRDIYKRTRNIFLIVVLIFSFFVMWVPTGYCAFTYGNWSWDGTNYILTMIANATNNEGNTEANAYSFSDITSSGVVPASFYNVSDSGTQFEFAFRIVLGDGTVANATWFTDTNTHIVFADGIITANYQSCFRIEDYAHATFGTLVSQAQKSTCDGVCFINEESNHYSATFSTTVNGELNFYSSTLISAKTIDRLSFRNGAIYNSIFNGRSTGISVTPINMDIYNTYLTKGYEGWRNPSGTTFDKLWSFDASVRNLYMLGGSNTITNLYQRNGGSIYVDAREYTQTIVNSDIDSWSFLWYSTGSGSVQRQYTFDLTVTYRNGTIVNGTQTGARVAIQHYGQNPTVDYNQTLGADGTIPQQTLTRGFYNQTGGDTVYSYNPYNLYIYNVTGFSEYASNFTLSEETDWTITLQAETAPSVATRTPYGILLLAVCFAIAIPLGLFVLKKRR